MEISDILAKHPELTDLLELKTTDEIIHAFEDGGTVWEVKFFLTSPYKV